MRDLINLIRPLFEEVAVNPEELEGIKSTLSLKIKQLPDTPETAKLLSEIEDILTHINAGGKIGIINNKLEDLNDPTVLAAQKEIARFIASIDMTSAQRDELFSSWKSDKLVDVDKLLSTGKHSFNDIFSGYSSNSAIRELVDELMEVSALGQGKGEFGFNVLSKRISKPVGKGDLMINGRKIEVKTVHKAAARFTDREVKPAAGYEAAAQAVTSFVKTRKTDDPGFVPTSGLNLRKAIQFGQGIEKDDQTKYYGLVEQLIKIIFGGPQADDSDVSAIMKGIETGSYNEAIQAYARASFNYYMSLKDDEGVLYISLVGNDRFTIFYKSADELAEMGQRFQAESVYITSSNFQEIYPKISIVGTSQGASGATPTNIAQAQARTADIDQQIQDIDKPTLGIRPKGVATRAKREDPPRQQR